MQLVMLHVGNSFNYGSAMMCINFINNLSKKGIFKYIIDADSEVDLYRYKNESKEKNIIKLNKLRVENSILNYGSRLRFILNEIEKNDPSSIIVLGGDDLTEYYSGKNIISELIRIYLMSQRYDVYLVCQNIGPFKSWRHIISKILLKNCIIYTRDNMTYDYLKNELSLDRVNKSSDLAFLELPLQTRYEKDKILLKYGLKSNEYLTMVPSGLVSHYTSDYDSYIDSWILLIQKIFTIKKLKDKKIVLLSHVLKPTYVDDRKIIKSILDKISNSYKDKIVPVIDEMLPSEARIILGSGYFTITCRMHAAISTLQMGKPAISLSYSLKYDGVIGQMMDLQKLVINANNDEIWSNKVIVNFILEKIEYILNNYDELINHINKYVNINSNMVTNTMDHIFEAIKCE